MSATSSENLTPITIRHLEQIQEVDVQPGPARATVAAVVAIGAAALGLAGWLLAPVHEPPRQAASHKTLDDLMPGPPRPTAPWSLDELSSAGGVPSPVAVPAGDQPAPPSGAETPAPSESPSEAGEPASLAAGAAPGREGGRDVPAWLDAAPWETPSALRSLNADVLPRASGYVPNVEWAPVLPATEDSPRPRVGPYLGPPAQAGTSGGYQVQVSSLRDKEDAVRYAEQLRQRGHRAHVESVALKVKGLWHRVRIGPFTYRRSAEIYARELRASERIEAYVARPSQPVLEVKPAEPEAPDAPDAAADPGVEPDRVTARP